MLLYVWTGVVICRVFSDPIILPLVVKNKIKKEEEECVLVSLENHPNGKNDRGPAKCHLFLPRIDVVCPAAVEIDAQVLQRHSYSDRREAALPIDTSQRSSHLCISLFVRQQRFLQKEKLSIFSIVSRIRGRKADFPPQQTGAATLAPVEACRWKAEVCSGANDTWCYSHGNSRGDVSVSVESTNALSKYQLQMRWLLKGIGDGTLIGLLHVMPRTHLPSSHHHH